MIHLSVECSTGVLGLALLDDQRCLGKVSLSASGAASEILPQSVALLLESSKKRSTDIRMISVSKGPGNYSSLRVAHSFGSGLAISLGVPLVSVSPFETLGLQWRLVDSGAILLVIDARQSEVLGELRVRDPITGDWICDPEWSSMETPVEIGELLQQVRNATVIGPGVVYLPDEPGFLWPSLSFPSGTDVPPDPIFQGRAAFLSGGDSSIVYGRDAVG
ncbi:MAG: tRNA (adenosine(37)-N6)-threonylcarbamoyltransferase complex dimerization subunit type 1 TsaB [Leptospirillum sp.]|jgi:tRNA threonylcarbamoyladenosine biosynthesis protein TsaB